MHHLLSTAIAFGLFLTACNRPEQGMPFQGLRASALPPVYSEPHPSSAGPAESYSHSIPIPMANRMIKSYRDAVQCAENTQALRYWIFNADTLRNWLNSSSGQAIKNLKIYPAHTMQYILSGHEGQLPPVNSHALTVIIVGLDSNNHYVYSSAGGAYNRCMPCPSECLNGDDDDLLPPSTGGVN